MKLLFLRLKKAMYACLISADKSFQSLWARAAKAPSPLVSNPALGTTRRPVSAVSKSWYTQMRLHCSSDNECICWVFDLALSPRFSVLPQRIGSSSISKLSVCCNKLICYIGLCDVCIHSQMQLPVACDVLVCHLFFFLLLLFPLQLCVLLCDL